MFVRGDLEDEGHFLRLPEVTDPGSRLAERPDPALIVGSVGKDAGGDLFHASGPRSAGKAFPDDLVRKAEKLRGADCQKAVDALVVCPEGKLELHERGSCLHLRSPCQGKRSAEITEAGLRQPEIREILCPHRDPPAGELLRPAAEYFGSLRIGVIVDQRHTGFHDPGLFPGDFRYGVPEVLHVVKANGGDHCEAGVLDAVRGVQPSAETCLKDDPVCGELPDQHRENEKDGLKISRDRPTPERKVRFRTAHRPVGGEKGLVAYRNAVEGKALRDLYQMGRGENGRGFACSPENAVQKRADRAFSVGAGHMDHLVVRQARLKEVQHGPQILCGVLLGRKPGDAVEISLRLGKCMRFKTGIRLHNGLLAQIQDLPVRFLYIPVYTKAKKKKGVFKKG